MKTEEKIIELVREPLNNIGVIVDKCFFARENRNNYLRIVIDKEPYIDIDDCVSVSKIIGPIIESANIINEPYILDVCSKEKGGI